MIIRQVLTSVFETQFSGPENSIMKFHLMQIVNPCGINRPLLCVCVGVGNARVTRHLFNRAQYRYSFLLMFFGSVRIMRHIWSRNRKSIWLCWINVMRMLHWVWFTFACLEVYCCISWFPLNSWTFELLLDHFSAKTASFLTVIELDAFIFISINHVVLGAASQYELKRCHQPAISWNEELTGVLLCAPTSVI